VIFAVFRAIYVRGAVVSRVAGKTATDETNGKAGPSKERPYRRPHAREEHRVAISDYLIACSFRPGDVRSIAEHEMEMVAHHGIATNLDGEEPR
jgi:hypothetical protein